jgi:RNA polymerase sigma factor (sigma-70 family)
MENYSLKEKVNLFNAGDEVAFRCICDICQDALLNFTQRYFSSRQEAEDITSETLLKLWKHRGQFSDIENIRLFIFKVAKHACYDRLRSTKVYCIAEESFFEDKLLQDPSINEQDWIRSSLLEKLHREIASLPPRCREVISMAYFDRLTNPEIGVLLGIKEKTVRNLKNLGMKRLRLSIVK